MIEADIGFSLSKWKKALYFILLQDDNSGRVLWFYREGKVYIKALTAKWILNVWLWVLVVIFCILSIWYTTRYIYAVTVLLRTNEVHEYQWGPYIFGYLIFLLENWGLFQNDTWYENGMIHWRLAKYNCLCLISTLFKYSN